MIKKDDESIAPAVDILELKKMARERENTLKDVETINVQKS